MILEMTKDEFNLIRKIIENCCGISLDDSKEYLIKGRLAEFSKKYQFANYRELYMAISTKKSLLDEAVELLTTQETQWFRDIPIWDVIKDKILYPLILAVAQNKKEKIRIWSAACSTGQEPYSLGICLMSILEKENLFNQLAPKIEILATDLSLNALSEAGQGSYGQAALERGPTEKIISYFTKEGNKYKINKNIKNWVTFKQINLLDNFHCLIPPMDLILCRNVAIYFSDEIKCHVFANMAKTLGPEGTFFVGSSETMIGTNINLERDQRYPAVCYRLKSAK
ncbi:MAG: protein-glutamate O-methyltransferase CheR [Pseudomonadota bacterium]